MSAGFDTNYLFYVLGWLFFDTFLCYCSETDSTCSKININHTIGKKLPVFPVKSLKGIGPSACFKECQLVSRCLSVNYNTNHLICELVDRKRNDDESLINDGDFIYMELADIVSKCRNTSIKSYSLSKEKNMYTGIYPHPLLFTNIHVLILEI
jgi:hypothetical protein